MSVQLQERYGEPIFSQPFGDLGGGSEPPAASGFSTATGSDTISRLLDPWAQSGAGSWPPLAQSGGIASLLTQLLSAIAQLLGYPQSGAEQYFSSASGGSAGDPHLSFNGSTWNDMQSQGDLLQSDSIPGGYRLSTQTTAPNASGVTYNQQASVTTDCGNTVVSLDKNGCAQYTQNGVTNAIAAGQTLALGNGETVTRSQNGSLTIANTAQNGAQITTTMTQNGQGVDVNVTASNAGLAGALVTGPASGSTAKHPPYRRY